MSTPPAPPTTIRTELQGLRAVALASVLFFHVAPRSFPVGFLGVDVFFVISGYLMCSLLSWRAPLNWAKAGDFFFRRVKRLVPVYLAVIAAVLLAGCRWVSPFDFEQVAGEATPALLFYSNLPSVHQTDYFDFKSKMRLFLHTWSLSTEVQFYTLVPAFVAVLGFLAAVHSLLPHIFLLLVIVASFVQQTTAEGVAAHMTLDGRLWQFAVGFAAQFAYEAELFGAKEEKNGKKWGLSVERVSAGLLPLVLLILLLFDLEYDRQLQRLLMIIAAFGIVAGHSNENSLLSHELLVRLGDVSYAVYLIHWPLFVLHRSLSEKGEEVGVVAAIGLIATSIAVGWAVETAGRRAIGHVRSWRSLLVVLLLLYGAAFGFVGYLRRNSLSFFEETPYSSEAEAQRLNATLWLWDNRESNQTLSPEEAARLNTRIAHRYETCRNKTRVLPLRSEVPLDSFKYICHEKGSGKKNILVIGNSHASVGFLAVAHFFKSVAKNLTLIATPGCMPVPVENQQRNRNKKEKEECGRMISRMVAAVRAWQEPIDVIIVLVGYNYFNDPPLAGDLRTDRVFEFMSAFYSNVSAEARELVIVGGMNVHFDFFPVGEVQKRLKAGRPVGRLFDMRKHQLEFLPNMRRRLDALECPKCVKVDWTNFWCGREQSGVCEAVDPHRPIALFVDKDHPTTYGSFLVGEHLLQVYQQHAG